MAEFFLHQVAVAPASYQVHEQNCRKLEPVITESRYLGSYAWAKAPIDKALGLYSDVRPCPECIKS